MNRAHLSLEGVLMARRETAGGFERLDFITAGEGLVSGMRRLSRKSTQTLPDLFDHCTCELEGRSGNAWFVHEYQVVRRHGGIGQHYATLREASAWARFVLANAPHMDSTAQLHTMTLQALDAWDRGGPPEVVHLKALYLVGRDEGLPVKEQWLRDLPAPLRQAATTALGTPAQDLQEVPPQTEDLVVSLRRWLADMHHLVDPGDGK